ncbi:hypothetical protein AS850_03115 [Frondihabitans sp. 762G35]|uniref:TetR family transcriptional regulator C-terminal domain-containing protein n=1 Tax=Frondihabitans sp. 762G35 TaxID=1446794 RepID=UPI000D215B91|nr:TetR family transcriptional regulator C-terminal domain-containing protein [Frondihabitans sp. 762G35]ARC56064.1 hypothetical protein AS850_03115 [Frondihabitans sp. 762G35]
MTLTDATSTASGTVEGAIAEAARRIATSSGLTAITLRRVASTAALSPADVAAREPSMSALAARTFADLAHDEFSRIRDDLGECTSPLDGLRFLVTSLQGEEHSLSKTVWADAWSVGRHNEFVAAAARTSMDAWQSLLTDLVDDGVRSGDFRVADSHLAALLFFALIDSTTAYGLVGYRSEAERADLITFSLESTLGLEPGTLAAR